jgi:hypothetical protein
MICVVVAVDSGSYVDYFLAGKRSAGDDVTVIFNDMRITRGID